MNRVRSPPSVITSAAERNYNEKWAPTAKQMGHDSDSDEDSDNEEAPEISRLTDYARLYTFNEAEEKVEETAEDDFADIIGPEPDEQSSLENLKVVLSSLKPYLLSRLQEKRQLVQVLEIYPTGETGYKTAMSLSRLALLVHELVAKIEVKVVDREGESFRGDYSDRSSTASPIIGMPAYSTTGSPGEITQRNKIHDIREIQYYDLRYLENQFNAHEEPMVLVRKHAVIVSLSPLRAIVTADRIVLSVPDGADALLYMLHEHMHEIVEDTEGVLDDSGYLAPEIRAYKALFLTIIAIHQQEYSSICRNVDKSLKQFRSSNKITSAVREKIRVLKNTVEAQKIKVKAYQRLLNDLLRNKEDMALMNLSLLKDSPHLYKKPLSLEILQYEENVSEHLESYLLDYDTLDTKLDFLRVQIENTNRLVIARLNTFQNDLLIVQVVLDCIMVALSVGMLIGAAFGMHLMSGLETVDAFAFWVFAFGIIFLSAMIFVFLHRRYRLAGIVPLLNAKKRQHKENMLER